MIECDDVDERPGAHIAKSAGRVWGRWLFGSVFGTSPVLTFAASASVTPGSRDSLATRNIRHASPGSPHSPSLGVLKRACHPPH